MASILDLYAAKEKELGIDTIGPGAAFKGKYGGFYSGDATPYSDPKLNPDGKVLTPDKLKSGYFMGELGGGSKYAPGYNDAKGKTYSEQVKK